MRIKNNSAAQNILRRYGENLDRVQQSMRNLSSGKRVRDGTDGGASLYITTAMHNKVAGMNQAESNTETSISLLQTAEGALADAVDIVLSMKQLAVHAANEVTNDPVLLQTDQMELDQLLETLKMKTEMTTFSGKKLLNGTMGVTGTVNGDNLRFVKADVNTPGSPPQGFKIDITQPASRAEMVGIQPLTVENLGEGFNILVREGRRVVKLDTSLGSISKELNKIRDSFLDDPQRFPAEKVNKEIRQIIIHQMNVQFDRQSMPLDAMLTYDNLIKLRHDDYGDHLSFSVTCSLPGILFSSGGKEETAIPGKDVAGSIGGEPASGHGRMLTARPGTVAAGAMIEYFGGPKMIEVPVLDENGNKMDTKMVEQEVDELVGKNLEGYLHISQQAKAFQMGNSSTDFEEFSLKDIRPNMLAVDVENKSNFRSLADVDLTIPGGANDAISLINAASEELSEARMELGSFQKHALKRNLGSIHSETENINRGISTISDTNTTEEIAEMTKNKILMQTSQSMLAQANQKPRHVLSLIKQS